jgi:hypothetical protein
MICFVCYRSEVNSFIMFTFVNSPAYRLANVGLDGAFIQSGNRVVPGMDDIIPSISVIQLSPVTTSRLWYEESTSSGVLAATLSPALLAGTTSSEEPEQSVSCLSMDKCCQTTVSWLGPTINYIIENSVQCSGSGSENGDEPILIDVNHIFVLLSIPMVYNLLEQLSL